MRPFVIALLLTLALPCLAFAAQSRPNVVIFVADDMGMGDSSAYQDLTGNADVDQIDTPAMEELAQMGVRFSDAHTPSSRCSPTRYGLLTGRYPWRNRLKHFVLFGSQGDPTIEADRPTLGTLFQSAGYETGIVGKWHVGLRYRRSDGSPAAGFLDADLTQPLLDGPAQHGFDYARFTARSHGTSGPDPSVKKSRNTPDQDIGPGHIHGDRVVSATGNGRQLVADGPDAYLLHQLGSRHFDHALEFLRSATADGEPFFLYYPSNSNHSPYTADERIGDRQVSGASRSKSGVPMGARFDFIYENDVALGGVMEYLETTDDPRSPGQKLMHNTIVIFTSDNGAEIKDKTATGPFRSHKGSTFEGGHRVPFIVSWPAGGLAGGRTSDELISLVDLYATFSEILGRPLPDLREGEKGAEDSRSVLAAWQGGALPSRPYFYHDHVEAEGDPAVSAFRVDNPVIDGEVMAGQWKLFFDASLLRRGRAEPIELYDLATDSQEENNLLGREEAAPIVRSLTETALLHRNGTGHRATAFAPEERITYDWLTEADQPGRVGMAERLNTHTAAGLTVTVTASTGQPFEGNPRGMGVSGGDVKQVDDGEALLIQFNQDVLVESVGLIAGNGQCGGFYRLGEGATQDIYCLDAHIDSHDQSGVISDIGVLKAGQILRLDSTPHRENENPGQWRLAELTVRPL